MQLLLATLVFIGIAIPINAAKLKCGQTPIRPNVMVKPKPKKEGAFEHRIMGGMLTIPHSWPWQVLLVSYHGSTLSSYCGGTIIAQQWILTAAHCFPDEDADDLIAYVGLQSWAESSKPMLVHKIYDHPKFNETSEHDITLIKLKRPIKYNKHVQPVCLPSVDENIVVPPNTAWATGWGDTSFNGVDSDELLEVNVPFVDFDTCIEKYKGSDEPPPQNGTLQVCAGKKGKDTCQGDSGGPLIAQSSDGSWFQHGITSYGDGCGGDYPGVYTRVSGYCDWIESTTRGAAVCH